MISFGAIYGGPTKPNMDVVFSPAMQLFEELRPQYANDPLVNIVFHIPGELEGVDFEGVRTVRVDMKKRACLVEAAVPADIVCSTDVEVVKGYLKSVIDKAGFLAGKRLGKVNITLNPEDYSALADQVLEKIKS